MNRIGFELLNYKLDKFDLEFDYLSRSQIEIDYGDIQFRLDLFTPGAWDNVILLYFEVQVSFM